MNRRDNYAPNIRPINKIPALIDITEPHNLHGVDQPPATQTASPADLIKAGATHAGDAIRLSDPASMRYGVNIFYHVGLWFYGADPNLPAVDRPPYADLVPTAGQCYLDNKHSVQEVAPAAAQVADPAILSAKLNQLNEVRKAKGDLMPVLEMYNRLEDNLLVDIFKFLERVNQVAQSSILSNVTLSSNLQPFLTLFSKGAEDSLQSRKNNEQVAHKAVEETLDKVRKALEDQKKAVAPGAPPPAVDLDALKPRRNR